MCIFADVLLIFILSFSAKPLHFAPPFLQSVNDGLEDFIPSGSTTVLKDAIRLTPQDRNKEGFLWTRKPSEFPEFESTFTMNVTGIGSRGGDGIAFYYAKEPHKAGSILNSPQKFEGIGLIFDSINRGHGRGYHSIRIVKGGLNNIIGGCTSIFRNSQVPFFVRVLYSNQILRVAFSNYVRGGRKIYGKEVDSVDMYECFSSDTAHIPIDLPPNYYFGFHASTGNSQDIHEVRNLDITPPVHTRTLLDNRGGPPPSTPTNPATPPTSASPAPSSSFPPGSPASTISTGPGGAPDAPGAPLPIPAPSSDAALTALQEATGQAERQLSALQTKAVAAANALQGWLDTVRATSAQNAGGAGAVPVNADELRREFAALGIEVAKNNAALDDFVKKTKEETGRVSAQILELTTNFEKGIASLDEARMGAIAELRRSTEENAKLQYTIVTTLIASKNSIAANASFSWGLWGFVGVVQIVFIFSLYFCFKKREEQNRKLI